MAFWPAMVNVAGRRCVIVGGGAVAARRARSLIEAGAAVTVIAPAIDQALVDLELERVERAFTPTDLDDAFLVVIATNETTVNDAVAEAARERRVLVNRTDRPAESDLTVPAHAHHGPVTIAVDTNGVSAAASAAIRRQLSAALDPAWPRLLELARPYRDRVQQACHDSGQRQARLRRLTDQTAMNILKTDGEAALQAHLAAIAAGESEQ